MGRIGTMTYNHLKALGVTNILCNDIRENPVKGITYVSKNEIYEKSDIISLHVPLTGETKNMISEKEINNMKSDVYLINTARGGIINEKDLANALKDQKISGAAIDVFEKEPYDGPLKDIERCLLTAHMGSMSVDCRIRMEIESTEEAIRFFMGKKLESEVPQEEYEIQSLGL